jgi:hypothetical protein
MIILKNYLIFTKSVLLLGICAITINLNSAIPATRRSAATTSRLFSRPIGEIRTLGTRGFASQPTAARPSLFRPTAPSTQPQPSRSMFTTSSLMRNPSSPTQPGAAPIGRFGTISAALKQGSGVRYLSTTDPELKRLNWNNLLENAKREGQRKLDDTAREESALAIINSSDSAQLEELIETDFKNAYKNYVDTIEAAKIERKVDEAYITKQGFMWASETTPQLKKDLETAIQSNTTNAARQLFLKRQYNRLLKKEEQSNQITAHPRQQALDDAEREESALAIINSSESAQLEKLIETDFKNAYNEYANTREAAQIKRRVDDAYITKQGYTWASETTPQLKKDLEMAIQSNTTNVPRQLFLKQQYNRLLQTKQKAKNYVGQ